LDILRWHQECGSEDVGLMLDFLDAPYLVAVCDKMPEFMGAVKPGSRAIVLVSSEYDDRPVRKGQRECIHVGGVEWQANYQDSLLFECPDDIQDWPAWQAERTPYLKSYFL
jgi:hypothetical protein